MRKAPPHERPTYERIVGLLARTYHNPYDRWYRLLDRAARFVSFETDPIGRVLADVESHPDCPSEKIGVDP